MCYNNGVAQLSVKRGRFHNSPQFARTPLKLAATCPTLDQSHEERARSGNSLSSFSHPHGFDAYVTVPPDVTGQDEVGRLWDIIWMLRFAIPGAGPVATACRLRFTSATTTAARSHQADRVEHRLQRVQ